MKLNDVLKRAVHWYKSGVCIYLRGPVGRGKTTVIGEVPKLLSKALGGNYGFACLSGPLLTPTDSIGYLMPHVVDGRMESKFTEPFWFRTSEGKHLTEYDGGVILVDEADKMDPDVKKCMGEAAQSSRLGPHVIPKGWVIWMAGNRAQDRSGSTKEYDHLINRRKEINVDDDLDSLVDWMSRNGVHPVFTAFVKSNPQVVFEEPPAMPGPWCTPRSICRLAEYAAQVSENGDIPLDPLFKEEASGMIGDAAQMQLFATLELQKVMPKFEDIVANPKKEKVPENPDAQMMVCFTLAARADVSNLGALITYVERMPAEFTITFGRAAISRDMKLITTPAFADWTRRNAPLMMAITSL
jgi:hypothetical protein